MRRMQPGFARQPCALRFGEPVAVFVVDGEALGGERDASAALGSCGRDGVQIIAPLIEIT